MRAARLKTMLLIGGTVALISCGGGGGNGNNGGGSPTPTPKPALKITTASNLPPTLEGHSYSATLSAQNGQGALHWAIGPISATASFVDGLSVDANTGVISGTANFGGTGGFLATVTDSGSPSQSASATFSITAYQPLTSTQSQLVTVTEFQTSWNVYSGIQGGFPPVGYSVTSGTLPPGLRFNSSGQLTGAAYATGTYQFTITAQDSFSPPETATQSFTITVKPPSLSVPWNSISSPIAINRPFSGKVVAVGGVPPYTFSQFGGTALPPGLSLDASTGVISGTPTSATYYNFEIQAADSSSPPQTAWGLFDLRVVQSLGRNDTPATATPIDNGGYSATISPYIDPPNGAPFAADHDYYKLVSAGGATVHLETFAKRNNQNNPLDTVIEVVDGNGVRLNTCRQPGDTSTTFAGPCINDDISASPHVQDSAIDFQVPGTRDVNTTFCVHVFDWRGDARPDMFYNLNASGVVDPLTIISTSLQEAYRGKSYAQQFTSNNGLAPISWSVASGTLPPGLTLSSQGAITGTPTTDGTFNFTIQASDSGTPAETATIQGQIVVTEPVTITTPATWPDACVGQPYSFTVQVSGGVPPIRFQAFWNYSWPLGYIDATTGTQSGIPASTGSFTEFVDVQDSKNGWDSQQVTLTVNQCP